MSEATFPEGIQSKFDKTRHDEKTREIYDHNASNLPFSPSINAMLIEGSNAVLKAYLKDG